MTDSRSTPLPGLENLTPGAGDMERQTFRSIEAIKEARPLSPGEQMYTMLALALARNIDAGNRKGRAIANEALQLVAVMQLLEPQPESLADPDNLPPDLRSFLDAFATAPRLDTPSASYSAELR